MHFNGSIDMEKNSSSDAYQWAYGRFVKGDPEMERYFEEMGVKADIARQLYNLREQAGLSQEQLAELVGTDASVIEDIEEADYEGDFLGLASRIANTLHRRVEVRLVTVEDMDATGIAV
jgi:ribosome-binding protein aMBF1 (putative translation factor)